MFWSTFSACVVDPNFQKITENAYLACFTKFCPGAENLLAKPGLFLVFCDSSENKFSQPKKKLHNFFENSLVMIDPPLVLWLFFLDLFNNRSPFGIYYRIANPINKNSKLALERCI